jgi:hypothetical protein
MNTTYNEGLTAAFRFENDWYALASRCCYSYYKQDHDDLTRDVCSDLIILAHGKLRDKIAQIPDLGQMIKYFSKCAKLLSYRINDEKITYLPTINKHQRKCRNKQEYIDEPAEFKFLKSTDYGTLLADVDQLLAVKESRSSGLVTNKFALARLILRNLNEDYEFKYTTIYGTLGRSTIEAAMNELRSMICQLDPAFDHEYQKIKADRIKRRVARSKERHEKWVAETQSLNDDDFDYDESRDRYECIV